MVAMVTESWSKECSKCTLWAPPRHPFQIPFFRIVYLGDWLSQGFQTHVLIINEIWIDEIFHSFPFDTSPSIRSEFHRRASSYAEPSGQLPGKPRWVEIDPEHWSLAVDFLKILSFVCGYILLTFKKLDRRPMTIRKYSCEFKMTSGGGQGHRYLREYVIGIRPKPSKSNKI